jgi:hypothetical protein
MAWAVKAGIPSGIIERGSAVFTAIGERVTVACPSFNPWSVDMTSQLNPLWYEIPLLIIVFAFLWFVLPGLIERSQKGKRVNPIAEAKVYLAYGQKKQAANVLKKALIADPANELLLAQLRKIDEKSLEVDVPPERRST